MDVSTFVQKQWFTRSADEKFASVDELATMLQARKQNSVAKPVKMSQVHFEARVDENDLEIVNRKTNDVVPMSNWAFSQVCTHVDAHPSYLSKLPAELAAKCLNHGFATEAKIKDRDLEMFMAQETDKIRLKAMTGGYYGRVWDATVVNAAQEIVHATDNRFYSPLDWTKEKRALFASDRDLTMLFIDGGSMLDIGKDAHGNPDVMHRGLLWWNSEVGAGALKFYTFLFRVVCGNFGIHGIEDVQFTKVRHTINAAGRFATNMLPEVLAYANASTKPLEEVIRKAKEFRLPKDDRKFTEYFQHRKFTKVEIAEGANFADKEEGGHDTLWQMYNGLTASARTIRFADKAMGLQQRAGKLLDQLAN